MKETLKLFDQDPYQKECEATILEERRRDDGLYEVVLDQTIFYPTGGGQPHDKGFLNDTAVIDVYKENGFIYHVIEASLKDKEKVTARIDWGRRFDFMQQHSGQHILSRVFEILYEAETVGFHLGEETVTIDIEIDELTEEMLQQAEKRTNNIVFENRPIVKETAKATDLPKEVIEKIPELEEFVTMVDIQDFDSCACSGTHPFYSGEVGLVKLLGWEKYKQKVRLSFVCGNRALRFFQSYQKELSLAAALLKTNRLDVVNNLEKNLQEHEALNQRAKDLGAQIISYEVEEFKAKAEALGNIKLIVHLFENRDFNEIRKLSQGITSDSGYAVIFVNRTYEKAQFLLDRSQDLSIPMNECIKIGLKEIEGKGGGNPKTAQGGGQKLEKLGDALEKMKEFILDQK